MGIAPRYSTAEERTGRASPGTISTVRRGRRSPCGASTVPHGSPARIRPQAVSPATSATRPCASRSVVFAHWMLPASR